MVRMPFKLFWRHLRSYFNNEAAAPFVTNAYRDVQIKEGRLRRKHRRVGWIELFLDLFLVASLSLFTSETDFGEGEKWASYCAFFVGLWSIWNAQVIFDVRFGGEKTDGLAILWTFLQLCINGMLAAVAGSFRIGYGLPAYSNPVPNPDIPPWVSPTGQVVDRPASVKRSLKVTFGVIAISRFLLFIQYGIVMVQAHRARKSYRPAFFAMCGLFASGSLFFGAMAASWGPFGNSQTGAITRCILFGVGWLLEYGATVASVLSSSSIIIELEYWTERFAALTLVILGEGVFGLFESYRSTFLGPTGGFNPVLVAIVIAAVGLYRVLYHLYFTSFSRNLRNDRTGIHLIWGFLHLPTHLSLLLLMQCAVRNIRTLSIFYGADPFVQCQIVLDKRANIVTQNGTALSVADYQDLLLNSDAGHCLTRWSTYLGANRASQIDLYASISANNATTFGNLCQAQSYSLLLRLWATFGFDVEAEVYDGINEYINAAQNDEDVINNALDSLFSVLYTSSKPAITCLGGFLFFVAILGCFQPIYKEPQGKVKLGFRALIGLAMLSLTLLNIGITSYTQQTPMDNLLDNDWLVPVMFFTGLTVVIFDGIVYLTKTAVNDSSSSISSTTSATREMKESSDG